MRTLVCALLLLVTAAARGDDLDPAGPLARWLDGSAGPQLAEVLARHPRFAGETTAFVAVVDGAPTEVSDQLHDAIERRLRRHVLRSEGVRLALPNHGDACSAAAQPDLLVGIEIVAPGGRSATVSLGLIDVVEGVWVSGVALDWRGTLAAKERRALATPSDVSAAALRALPVADADAVAEVLAERLSCAWPSGLAGRVHLSAAPEADAAPRIAAALRGRLGRGPTVFVADPESADWHLVLEVDPAGRVREARLLLAGRGEGAEQQLASVFVTGAGAVASAPGPTAIPVSEGAVAARAIEPRARLLAGEPRLEQVSRDGVCRRDGREVLCAELAVELERPGWLFVFSTRDGRARPLACDPTPERSDAGERRFRFSVGAADSPGRPDTGIYVLAVRDRDTARELARVLRTAPGACGTRDGRPLDYWLQALAELLTRAPNRIEWHAVHLVREGDRVIRI